MAEGLPEGLFTNTEAISENIESIHRVEDEELMALWRVYTTNKNLLVNDVSRRLENLFWRIWGNESVRTTITGAQIAALFEHFSSGETFQSAPKPSPDRKQKLKENVQPLRAQDDTHHDDETEVEQERKRSRIRSNSKLVNPKDNALLQVEEPQAPSVEEEKGRRRSSSRPPPILKKPGIEATSQSKTARILTPTWKTVRDEPAEPIAAVPHAQRPMVQPSPSTPKFRSPLYQSSQSGDHEQQVKQAGSAEVATSPGTASQAMSRTGSSNSASRLSKRTPSFVVSNKRRPSLVRRTSSNTSQKSSSSNSSKMTSPRLGAIDATPPSSAAAARRSSAQKNKPIPTAAAPPNPSSRSSFKRPTSRSTSPISSSPFARPVPDHRDAPIPRTEPIMLVDANFRKSFVDRAHAPTLPSSVHKPAADGPIVQQGFNSTPIGSVIGLSTYAQTSLEPDTDPAEKPKEKQTGVAKAAASPAPPPPPPPSHPAGHEVEDEDLDNLTLAKLPSQVMEDDDVEDPVELPRTKSQLTLLLEKEKIKWAREEKEKRRTSKEERSKGKKKV